jgi:hypothetical protein
VQFVPFVFEVEIADVAQDERAGGQRLVGAEGVQDGEVVLKIALVVLGSEDIELI